MEVMGRRRRRRLARARESRRAWSRERRLHEWRTYAQQVEALDAMNYVAPAVSRDGWRWHLECASVPKFGRVTSGRRDATVCAERGRRETECFERLHVNSGRANVCP